MNKRLLLSAPLACTLLAGCPHPIPINPTTNNDVTPPLITLHAFGDGPNSHEVTTNGTTTTILDPFTPIDVHEQQLGTPNPSIQVHENGKAELSLTVRDDESGIKNVALTCQRLITYKSSSGADATTQQLPEKEEQTFQLNNGNAPPFGALQRTLTMRGQMLFHSGSTNTVLMHGYQVSVKCFGEATNFNGQHVTSQAIVLWSKDRSVQP